LEEFLTFDWDLSLDLLLLEDAFEILEIIEALSVILEADLY